MNGSANGIRRTALVPMDSSTPALADAARQSYRFADLRLQADGTLLRGETALAISGEELDLLRALLARPEEVIPARELSQAVWGDPHFASHRLPACLASLQALLRPADCIQSVGRRGYRLSGAVDCPSQPSDRPQPLLAILPFTTGFDLPDHWGLAIAEELMNRLREQHSALVSIAALDSTLTLARSGLAALQVGRMLGAELVLTGQLAATPRRLRLRVEVFRVVDGASLWVEDLLMERLQMAEMAEELVNRVVSRLGRGTVLPRAAAAPQQVCERSSAQDEAHDLYLRAHHEWQNMERHRMQNAMGRLLHAMDLDPSLIAARVDLAQLSVLQCIYGYISPRIAAVSVRRAADAIPELNQQAVQLLPSLAWVEFHYDRDAHSALRSMARAAALPYDPANTRVSCWLLLSQHRFGEAIELLHAALRVDPWSPWLQTALGWSLHLAGRRDESVAQARKAIEMFSAYDNALLFGAMILGHNGETGNANEAAAMLVRRSPHYDLALAAQAYALACSGCAEPSRRLLERIRWLSRERYVLNTLNAATFVALGDAGAALAELRAAERIRCPWFFQMLGDPRIQPLRERPEFADLLAVLAAVAPAG